MSPKPGVSGASQGVAQLDFWSGLFLERGAGADEWVLEGRTWAIPLTQPSRSGTSVPRLRPGSSTRRYKSRRGGRTLWRSTP